jgi:PBP1b-binding outer membrane lipoprotein LpoB
MTRSISKSFLFLSVISALGIAAGCTVTTRTVSPKEELHYDEAYDFSDKKTIVKALVNSFLAGFPPHESAERPVIIIYGIANRTSEHISTSGITDDIRQARIQRARQVGARYMLTGTLRSIEKEEPRQVRLKKRSLKYYSLNLELTDIETGLIQWADSVEVIREASKPFIGW